MELRPNTLPDVILCTKLDGTRIPAHRDVLSRSCSYFEKCSTSQSANSKEIYFDDIPSSALNKIVSYCYTGVVTTDNMEVLIELADFFQLRPRAVSKCLELMSKNLCVESCMKYVIFTEKHGLFDYLYLSMEFIDQFFESIYKLNLFDEISLETLKCILKRDTLEVNNEEVVFYAILKWYKFDKTNREIHLHLLLELVRLSALDRTFIVSVFLDFCTEHNCVEALESANELLFQGNNLVHKTSNRRVSDKIVAFNDNVIQIYSARTKKWATLTYVEPISKSLAFEDRWMGDVKHYSLILAYSSGYASCVRKLKLTTGQIIFEKKLPLTMTQIKTAEWTEGNDCMFYLVGHNQDINTSQYLAIQLNCTQYNSEVDVWESFSQIYQLKKCFRIVYVDSSLYVVGASTNCYEINCRNTPVCRYSFEKKTWEKCPVLDVELTEYCLGVTSGCIYVVSVTSLDNLLVNCFNPKRNCWTSVAHLNGCCTNIKVCRTNKFLYVVGKINGIADNEQWRVCRYDPHINRWHELDPLKSMCGNFSLFNVTKFYY